MRQALATRSLILGRGVGGLAGETRVEPEVEEVCAERGPEERPDDASAHTVLVRGGDGRAC